MSTSLAPRGIIELAQDPNLDVIISHVHDAASLPAFTDQPQHQARAWSEEFLARYCPWGIGKVRLELRVGRREDEILAAVDDTQAQLIALGWSQELDFGRASIVREVLRRGPVPWPARAGARPRRRRGNEGGIMEQIAIVAHLKSGAEQPAAELVAKGPPFDPEEHGFDRHTVYVSADEVVFVFEGHEVEWIVDRLVDEPFHWLVMAALEEWRPLLKATRGSHGRPTPGPAKAWTAPSCSSPHSVVGRKRIGGLADAAPPSRTTLESLPGSIPERRLR